MVVTCLPKCLLNIHVDVHRLAVAVICDQKLFFAIGGNYERDLEVLKVPRISDC